MNQLSLFDFPVQKLSEKKTENEKSPFEIYAEVLIEYLPEKSLEQVCNLLVEHDVYVKITRKRYTKLGDYRPPQNGKGHRITINHNLNKYAFLLTMIHEIAHLVVWKVFKRNAKPHGNEWKLEFRKILQPFIHQENFPSEIIFALNNYLKNPAASSCADENLYKTLKIFDEKNSTEKNFYLEEISENSFFSLVGNSKIFKKGKKLRKRFLCKEIYSKRKYLVSSVAEVKIVEK